MTESGHTYIAWEPPSEGLSPQEAENRFSGHPGSYISHALYAGAGAARHEGSLATPGEDGEHQCLPFRFANSAEHEDLSFEISFIDFSWNSSRASPIVKQERPNTRENA